jgi:hypothetical protein
MKRFALLTTIFTAVLTLVLPFVGGGGPSLADGTASASVSGSTIPRFASPVTVVAAAPQATAVGAYISDPRIATTIASHSALLKVDSEHLAQKPVPKIIVPPVTSGGTSSGKSTGGKSTGAKSTGGSASGGTVAQRQAAQVAAGSSCPGNVGGAAGGAPSRTSAGGVAGTTSADVASFAAKFNSIRVSQCLQPIPMANFRYDSCMETRLFWVAEDPSTDPNSAWGHMGSVRSDGVPSVGCDGNLAGGSGNTGATVAQKWWDSLSHRASLYRPSYAGSTANVCISFAMVHGGIPNEPYGFTRAAARWISC